MNNPFLSLYDRFARHRTAFWLTLVGSVILLAVFAVRVRFEENISSFFDDGSGKDSQEVFENLKIKDRIVVMLTGEDADLLVEAGYTLSDSLATLIDEGLLTAVTSATDDSMIGATTDFVYRYLPLWLEEDDYERMASQLTEEGIRASVAQTYRLLTSATGIAVGSVVQRDPLALGSHLMRRFERFATGTDYEIYEGQLFTADMRSLLLFLSPMHGMGSTGSNDRLVSRLEEQMQAVEEQFGIEAEAIGGPVVAVYNARQIKRDTALTLSLALVVIVGVLFCSFRSRRAIPLMVTPPIYGALFALTVIYFVQGEMSAIAIGAGAVILGIALSYSIHVVSHSNHEGDPRRVIEDLTYPLTVGCLTTIGAFLALLFTHSALLHDLGLFSALSLIGTTLFCLVFLPHFLGGMQQGVQRRLMHRIERLNSYDYARNRWAVGLLLALTIGGLFFYRDAGFDSNMASLNYMPQSLIEAEERLEEAMGDASRQTYLVTSHADAHQTLMSYDRLATVADSLLQVGGISSYCAVNDFIIPLEEQERRIARWNAFWQEHRTPTLEAFERASRAAGFRDGAFPRFEELLTRPYEVCRYSNEELSDVPVFSDWINNTEDRLLLVSRVELDPDKKEAVYAAIRAVGNSSIIDRGYFSAQMVETANDDFNFLLLISSLIVFVALLISYGRIELALMTFLPMCITWVIILALMALFDIRFNIVNIILATFIFGIGDDFSIFIMDGLLADYTKGEKVLTTHKTAIFFSAFTTVVGMGVLILAKHPALKSIALISMLGMSVVVLVAYTLQPFLFRLLVNSQIKHRTPPYTLFSVLVSIYAFLYFLVGCILLQLLILVLSLLPIKQARRKALFHAAVYRFTRLFLATMPIVKTIRRNLVAEDYRRPSVIIANHQSFIDILLMLSTSPRLVMVTNSWVWHSPFFGRIVRYADCYHAADGYERLVEELRPRVEEGYSVVIFPEGTRSVDGRIGRFHKGAFYLADKLGIELLPMVIYGAGMVSSKRTGFHIRRGWLATDTMARIAPSSDYRTQSKAVRSMMKARYEALVASYNTPKNPNIRSSLHGCFLYKGPVLEWYIRIKCRLDGYYAFWHRILPREAVITDVGCGHGQLSMMLSLLAPERRILGLDYDAEKIARASHCYLCSEHLRFEQADMRTKVFAPADAFLFNDSLHYISTEGQREVLLRAAAALNAGGCIVVRDGDVSRSNERHATILRTEWWSTKILKFNRTEEPLQFVSRAWMEAVAAEAGLEMHTEACDRSTSETLYILTKRAL
ncbi:MAG: 1-acyl-sn-glycerol-3-phosphate acyltransferase [Rikenellaceae bacterium]|nr:1-acyl-sn-glycerol-3-phosphate acyltransferase [Rikenellaceae bacterium]